MTETLARLEAKRQELLQALAALGDFRRGTISVNYRKCGKTNCTCTGVGHPGHGPQYLWNATIGGQSRARNLRLGPELEKVGREVDTYRAFVRLCTELVVVNEQICQRRPVRVVADVPALAQVKKKLRRRFARKWPAKLGCVFTQARLDERGRPVRDEASTTYVGAIEPAEAFGVRLYAEAVRRGVQRAALVTVLGDGAPWIWGIAAEHFPGATQIVDLYHAREHLGALGKLLYGPGSPAAKQWAAARCQQLDTGEIEAMVAVLRRLRPRERSVAEAVRKAIEYFQTHAERMRYARFRRHGLFVGSGVIEAGCTTIVGQRLKQSGMRWTVRGANAIIALRCADLSGRWEEFWEARAVG